MGLRRLSVAAMFVGSSRLMPMTVRIERRCWLGYRWRGHGLGGTTRGDVLDDLLVLGLQGSRHSNGEHALSQRAASIDSTPIERAIAPAGPLVSMWSVRGAPHAHRASQLDLVRDALASRESDDAGPRFVEAVQEVAEVMGRFVTSATLKGDVSREVASSVSSTLVQRCERCRAWHIPDALFRAAGRQAQLVIGPEQNRATMLYPSPHVEQQKVDHPRRHLLEAYFRVNGPTTRTHYRDWQEAGTAGVKELWDELADQLVRVHIDGKRFGVPDSLVDSVLKAEPAHGVALVPPNDPYLRQSDRALLVPDSTRRKKVFKALSGPGALLVDGEIAGTWRYRRSDAKVSIETFIKLRPDNRNAAAQAASSLATSTGDEEPTITWS